VTSNIDPNALKRAALDGMPALKEEIVFDIDAAIAQGDPQRVWEMVPRLALLDLAAWGSSRSKLLTKFGKNLSVRDLDRAVQAERAKLEQPTKVEAGAEWRGRLLRNESGSIKPLLANAIACLRGSPVWQGVHAFDEFAVTTVTLKPTPWNAEPHAWSDTEDILLAEWLQHEGILISRELAGQAVEAVSRERSFHPVRQYLDALHWDGAARLSRWLHTYLGAQPDQNGGESYLTAVGSRWLISAVARVMRPGCKADCCLILEGPQGIKKSTALKTLAGAWFADEIADLGTKDASMQTRGTWIIELAELDSMARSEVSRVKAFMSRATDHFRPPYGKRVVNLPRQCIFAGSVNGNAYLRDETGGRRFWPVVCGSIDIEALERDRDQLWAEAAVRFNDKEVWWLETQELAEQARAVQADRYEGDVWDPIVRDWAETRIAEGRDSVSVPEILEMCLEKKPGLWTRSDEMRVSRGLQVGGWERYRDRKRGMEWRYRRV
jgi:predicted P-loop ATPase